MFTNVNFRCDSKLGIWREQMVARVYVCKRKGGAERPRRKHAEAKGLRVN
jgi:hypothetical protein